MVMERCRMNKDREVGAPLYTLSEMSFLSFSVNVIALSTSTAIARDFLHRLRRAPG